MRLDRFLSNLPRFNRQDARQLISQGRIYLDGQACRDALRAEYAQPEQQRAHYQVELAFGQRLEPWVQDMQLEPRHD